MSKKIKVGDCKVGRFYIIRGFDQAFFCTDVEEDWASFIRIGDGFYIEVSSEKVRPINIYMFAK